MIHNHPAIALDLPRRPHLGLVQSAPWEVDRPHPQMNQRRRSRTARI